LLYTRDEDRAILHERRGIKVAFGGLDDFFIELMKNTETSAIYTATGDPLDISPTLRPVTRDVSHEIKSSVQDASSMFNGWPASYADIASNLTFRRTLCPQIQLELDTEHISSIVILGASGTGKTTLSKQVMHSQA